MTPVFRLCDEYVTRWAALDPVAAGMRGIKAEFGAATDYSPEGYAARADLAAATLAELDRTGETSQADHLAAGYLRERLAAELAWHEAEEPLRQLSTPFGRVNGIRDSVDLLPRDNDDDWRNIAARMRAMPQMFRSWRSSLDAGLVKGL